MSLLEEWEMKEGSSATIDLLIQMVEQIDNVPAIQVLKVVKGMKNIIIIFLWFSNVEHINLNKKILCIILMVLSMTA